MENARKYFENLIQKQGYFLYLPVGICEGLTSGILDDIECLDLPGPYDDNRWQKFDLPEPTRSKVKDIIIGLYKGRQEPKLFPMVELQNRLQWGEIFSNFSELMSKTGYIYLLNGNIVEVLSATISFGTLHAPGGCAYTEYHPEDGHLIVVKNTFTKSRVTRLMRLTREHLHKVRRDNPAKIIEISKDLGLLK